MTQPRHLAFEPNHLKEIAALINRLLQPKNITAEVVLKNGCLQVILESAQVPSQQAVIPLIHEQLISLDSQSFKEVKVQARKTGEDSLNWQQEFELDRPVGSLLSASKSTAEVQPLISNPKSKQDKQLSPWKVLFGAVAGTVGGVGGLAIQAGQGVTGRLVGVAGAIAGAASQAPQGIRQLLDSVSHNPLLRLATKAVPVSWLAKFIDRVDVDKAEVEVRAIQQKYPQEKSRQIAHRLMVDKALHAGRSGLFSSLVPGFAVPLLALDLATTTSLQAEMVYQIACAYGLDIKDPVRKSEVLAIFGLSLGGGYAAKAGLGFLRNIPVAGAVIGASTNAAMLYTLGYAACRFYENKLNPLASEATLVAAQSESEKYLESALSQEVAMDQILVHAVLAGHPEKTWEELLPELQMHLSPASLEAIADPVKSPLPLETLLAQIDPDFAVPLLAQCQKIARSDQVITPEEAKIIEAIAQKLGLQTL